MKNHWKSSLERHKLFKKLFHFSILVSLILEKIIPMAYIVTDNCVNCKYTDCVEVCPVDCFYQDEKMLVIAPDECIDCGACEPECPVEAIYSEDECPEDQLHWLQYATDKWESLEVITEQQSPLPTADAKREKLGF